MNKILTILVVCSIAMLSGCIPESDSEYDDLIMIFGVSEKHVKVIKYCNYGSVMGDSTQYWKFVREDPNATTIIIDKVQLTLLKCEVVLFQGNDRGSSEVKKRIPVKATSPLSASDIPDWWPYASQDDYSIFSGKRGTSEGYELWIPKDANESEACFLYRGVY